jgi:hypothetical protein
MYDREISIRANHNTNSYRVARAILYWDILFVYFLLEEEHGSIKRIHAYNKTLVRAAEYVWLVPRYSISFDTKRNLAVLFSVSGFEWS